MRKCPMTKFPCCYARFEALLCNMFELNVELSYISYLCTYRCNKCIFMRVSGTVYCAIIDKPSKIYQQIF